MCRSLSRCGGWAIFGSRKNKPVAVVQRYIAALNERDQDTIASLLADDCRLVDSSGGWLEGRENAIEATRAFFDFDAEFRIDHDNIVLRGDEVLVRGKATAAHPQLAKDSLWRARVKDGKLAYWQSYGAEALPLVRILMPQRDDAPLAAGAAASAT